MRSIHGKRMPGKIGVVKAVKKTGKKLYRTECNAEFTMSTPVRNIMLHLG
jgi:hypothetical protein